MNTDVALYWTQQCLKLSLLVGGPILGAALVIGLLVAFFQAITSMQEMTLTYIPKMLIVGLLLLLLTPWMLDMLSDFTIEAFRFIPEVSR